MSEKMSEIDTILDNIFKDFPEKKLILQKKYMDVFMTKTPFNYDFISKLIEDAIPLHIEYHLYEYLFKTQMMSRFFEKCFLLAEEFETLYKKALPDSKP